MIGCGAIASSFHMPALASLRGRGVEVVLIDSDLPRARDMAQQFGFPRTAQTHDEVAGEIDGAVIATPHHTHAAIARSLVERGIPVLCEKPLGVSATEVQGLVERSAAHGVPVAVNQTRRFIPACRKIGEILRSGRLGPLQRVEWSEGDRFGWPTATPTMFGARSRGRGVMLDIGVHVFDLLSWWMESGLELVSCSDDSFGGSEAAATVQLDHGGVGVRVRLSWLARQENVARFVCEAAVLEWAVYDLDRLSLLDLRTGRRKVLRVAGAPRDFAGLAPRVIEDFMGVVRDRTTPAVAARDVLQAAELLDACYDQRVRYELPWHGFALPEGERGERSA